MTDPIKYAPDTQPLVGASEAAALMGVELSTFSHLRRREEAVEGSKFPKPLAVLRCGPIWKTSDIKRFAAKYTAPRPGPKPVPVKASKVAKVAAPVKAAAKPASNGHGTKVAAKKAVAKKVSAAV
jgi:hypothetical protein